LGTFVTRVEYWSHNDICLLFYSGINPDHP
jgi:hypothetical protein